jgi:hypothetical protein
LGDAMKKSKYKFKYKYMINEKTIDINDISRISYGIDIFDDTYGKMILLLKIYDISTDKDKVEELISSCNTLNASPTHIFEIIEDIL